MSTKLAIELLTQSHNNLTSFLSGLGLLENQTAITQLKTKFDAAFKTFLDDYDGLKHKVAVTSSQVETVGDKLAFAKEYHKVEEERLQELLLQKTALVKEIDKLKEQKASLEKFSDSEENVITDKIEAIKKDIIKTENDLANRRQEISNKEVLISTYETQINDFRAQETYHNGLAAQYDQESLYWGVVSKGKSGKKNYGWLTDYNKVALRDQEYAKAASADEKADDLAVKINTLQTQINEAKPNIPIVEKELIAHVLRLEVQKDILSLNGLDLTQKLATIDLQIKQQSDDLGLLNTTTITQQQTIVNTANTKLLAVQTELNKLQIDKTTAEKLLTDFETKNNYLLTDDVTGFLDWNVTENTPETVKLRQQILGVERLQVVKDRLTSLQSQALSEEAVKVALTENNIEGYVKLGGTLATEIKGLSDIWLENLQESHNLTVKVYDLSQKRTTDINDLVTYVEANFSDPQGNYVLDKIQLEEAIALQEAQVKYKDALSNSVDSLEEAIAVLQTQVEQYKIVSVKLDHISQLTSLEKQYVVLQNDYRIFDQKYQNLQNDYNSKISIRQQKEQQLAQAQQAYNNRIKLATSREAIVNPTTGNYYFLTNYMTWTEAQNFAQSLGANLVTINDSQEDAWIKQTFSSNLQYYYVGGDSGGYTVSPSLWIGLTRWNWASGETVSYSNLQNDYYDPENDPYYFPWFYRNYGSINSYSWKLQTEAYYYDDTIYSLGQQGIVEIDFKGVNQQLSSAQKELQIAQTNENTAGQILQNLQPERATLIDHFNQISPFLVNELAKEITNKTQDLIVQIDLTNDQQEQWIETNLQKYIQQKQSNILGSSPNQDQSISNLQNLRVETAYLTLQAEQDPNKLQQYLQAYQASDKTEATLNNLRNQYYPALNDATTLANLKQQITTELTNSQTQLETLKGQISQKQAASVASLSQAKWYEEQAQINWELSRKQGPTWNEYRTSKGKSGKSKTITITHVDHNWIIWDAYTKQATSLRQYAANLDKEISSDSYQKDLTASIISQWQQANATADDASLTLDQFIAQLEQLEAQSKLLPEQQAQLATFQTLLPVLKQQLETAQKAAEQAKTNTIKEQTEYDTSSQAYQTALNDILAKKTALDTNTQNLLQQIANTRAWIEQQTLSLDTEITETIALQNELKTQLDGIKADILKNAATQTKATDVASIAHEGGLSSDSPSLQTAELLTTQTKATDVASIAHEGGLSSDSPSLQTAELLSTQTKATDVASIAHESGLSSDSPSLQTAELLTKIAQIEQSLNLLTHKEIILTAQKAALTQKLTLLEAQKTVIETEHKLILATIASPDNDYSNLENQLLDAQKTLAEVQKLAEQAEATSIALTTSMEDLQAFLKVQNDQYLGEIQSKQKTLQNLITATQLKENYTLKATEKQLELNTLETQLITRLEEAKNAGSQEAAKLLEVAAYNNFATAAEIYYKDYRDLMTDKGGGCAGGIAKPDDAIKADYYYTEMVKYKALQDQAQQQVNQFALVKDAAEDQIDLIKQQQAIAQTEFNQIQSSLNNTQGNIDDLQQKLNIAEIRIDALQYLRNWTEQTLVQLLQVEQLNLGQAQLEQQFAKQRQLGIDESITAKFEKQRADINRDRAIATAKLEQLNQLQAEDALQQALNDLRKDLGLQPIEDIINKAEYQGQLAGILSDLNSLQAKPNLPDNIKTILAQTSADIYDALQGKEAATIQDNLLNSANSLIAEANKLQAELTKLDAEESKLIGILNQSQTDLQGAAKALYDGIQKGEVLGETKEQVNQQYLEVLYKIGYAQGAVDLSSELAKQSKDILTQIIEGRIKEREARKKAAFNEIFGTIITVLAVAGALFTGGATLGLYSATSTLATLGTNLTLASGALSAVQSAYNGDWAGAIFSLAMTAVSYQISNINSEIAQANKAVEVAKNTKDISDIVKTAQIAEATQKLDLLRQTLEPTLKSLQTFQAAAQGAYNTYKAIDSGNGTLAFLSAIQGVANVVAIDGVNIGETLDKSVNFSNFEKALITAGQVSVATYQAIEGIKTGNLLSSFESITQVAGTIGTNFATELTGNKISHDWLTLKVIVTAGEISVDAYKTVKAIEDEKWIDAFKSIGKVAKGIKENFKKQPEENSNNNDNSGSSNPPTENTDNKDTGIFTTIENTFEKLADKFEEYKNQLETYIKGKLGLSFDDLEKIGKTVEIGKDIYEDPSVKGWLKGIQETLTLWDKELNKVIGEDATLNVNTLKNINSTVGVLYGANQQGGLNAWLSSVKDVFGIWQDDLKNWVYKNFYDPKIAELAKNLNINPADIQVNKNGGIYYISNSGSKILIDVNEGQQINNNLDNKSLLTTIYQDLDKFSTKEQQDIIKYLQAKYPSEKDWLKDQFNLNDYEKVAGTQGQGYRLTSNGLELLNTSDYYATAGQNKYYDNSNGGGINHSDAIAMYLDYVKNGSGTFQQFYERQYLQIDPLTGITQTNPLSLGNGRIDTLIGSTGSNTFKL
ncbi:hypothetical protein, partial [Aphanothece sacrum]